VTQTPAAVCTKGTHASTAPVDIPIQTELPGPLANAQLPVFGGMTGVQLPVFGGGGSTHPPSAPPAIGCQLSPSPTMGLALDTNKLLPSSTEQSKPV